MIVGDYNPDLSFHVITIPLKKIPQASHGHEKRHTYFFFRRRSVIYIKTLIYKKIKDGFRGYEMGI